MEISINIPDVICAIGIVPIFKTLSILILSMKILANEYKQIYSRKIVPFFIVFNFESIKNSVIKIIMLQIDSYKNVGLKNSFILYSIGLALYGINNFQGSSVGEPNASELKKFPHLPSICPEISPKHNKSAYLKKSKLCFFA